MVHTQVLAVYCTDVNVGPPTVSYVCITHGKELLARPSLAPTFILCVSPDAHPTLNYSPERICALEALGISCFLLGSASPEVPFPYHLLFRAESGRNSFFTWGDVVALGLGMGSFLRILLLLLNKGPFVLHNYYSGNFYPYQATPGHS